MEKKPKVIRDNGEGRLDLNGTINPFLGVIARKLIEPLPEPKVVIEREPEYNLERLLEIARVRVRFKVEVECAWAIKKIEDGFREAKRRLETRYRLPVNPPMMYEIPASIRSLRVPIERIYDLDSKNELPSKGDPSAVYIVHEKNPKYFLWKYERFLDVTLSYPRYITSFSGVGGVSGVVSLGPGGRIPDTLLPSLF